MKEPGRPERRAVLLSGAVEHVLRHGAGGVSLRPLARGPAVQPVLRLYVEILGQAAAQVPPFPAAARRVAHQWLEWVQERLDVPVAERQAAAAALLATIDGLLVLDLAVGSEVADQASRRLLHRG